jgi:hypothetical protein
VTLGCADARTLRFVSSANQRSTRFVQLELVGSQELLVAVPAVGVGDGRSAAALEAAYYLRQADRE